MYSWRPAAQVSDSLTVTEEEEEFTGRGTVKKKKKKKYEVGSGMRCTGYVGDDDSCDESS